MEEKDVKKKKSSTKSTAKRSTTPKKAVKKVKEPEKKEEKVVAKKTTAKKASTSAKSSTKSDTKKKETTVKKTGSTKKSVSKSSAVTEKKSTKTSKKVLEESVVEKSLNEEMLEKTIIFDGTTSKNIEDVMNNLERENVILKETVIKRSSSRRVISIVLYVLIFIIAIVTLAYTVLKYDEQKNDGKTLNTNVYEKIKENGGGTVEKEEEQKNEVYKHINEISLSTFESKVLDGENIDVLVFSSTCYGCAVFEPILDKVLENHDKEIYKIDIVKLTDEENTIFRSYYAYTKTPTIFTIRQGIVASELVGTETEERLENWVSENMD